MELVVATKNSKKLREIKDLIKERSLKMTSLSDYPEAPRIIENGDTFKENAIKKAVKISRYAGCLTLGEDSGLCIEALKGEPGVRSSRFSGKNKSDLANNLKVLRLMKEVPPGSRKAFYVCAVALADCGRLLSVKEGKCYGVIASKQRGSSGFGYDPLFIIPGYGKTFAQLGEGVKHRISHRYHAMKQMREVIKKYIEKQRDS